MSINVSSSIKNILVGDSSASKVLLGNEVVWSKSSPLFAFANNYNGYIYVSTDKCATITQTTGKGYCVSIGNGLIVSAGYKNTYYSKDNGATWTALSGLPNEFFYAMAYNYDSKMFYTMSNTGNVYKSNGTSDWSYVNGFSSIYSSLGPGRTSIVYGDGVFMISGTSGKLICASSDCTSTIKAYTYSNVRFVDYSSGSFLFGMGFYLYKFVKDTSGIYSSVKVLSTFGSDDGYGFYHKAAVLSDEHLISAFNSNYSGAKNAIAYNDTGGAVSENTSMKVNDIIDYRASICRLISYNEVIFLCGALTSSYSSDYICSAVSYDYGHTWKKFNNYLCFSDGATNILEK